MVLTLRGQKYRYECENLCRLFFPYSPVKVDQEEPPRQGEPWALVCIEEREGEYVYRVEAGDGDRSLAREETRDRLEEYGITDLLYRALSELTGYTPAWGMLTGIHPVKLLRQYAEELGEEAGAEKFRTHCHAGRRPAWPLQLSGGSRRRWKTWGKTTSLCTCPSPSAPPGAPTAPSSARTWSTPES